METEEDDDIALSYDFSIPIDVLSFDEPKSAFVAFKRHSGICASGKSNDQTQLKHIFQIH